DFPVTRVQTCALPIYPRKALTLLDPEQPFAVIVADMRMPGMDGVEFLYEAKKLSPSSIRLMLTGDATRQTPIGAVNRGDVFKFRSEGRLGLCGMRLCT